eukprot:gene4788-5038_t
MGICFRQLIIGDGGYIQASRASLTNSNAPQAKQYGQEPTFFSSFNWWNFRRHALKVNKITGNAANRHRPLILLNDKRFGPQSEGDRRMILNIDEVAANLTALYPAAEADQQTMWKSFYELDHWFPLTYVDIKRYEIPFSSRSDEYEVKVLPGWWQPKDRREAKNWWLYNADVKIRVDRLKGMLNVALRLPHANVSATQPESINSSEVAAACPAWFEEYERFHSQHRLEAGAKYLVHKAAHASSGGLGDRLRGMLFTIKAAYALKRVVLFTWADPFEVTNFFVPAGAINWTLHGITMEPGPEMKFTDQYINNPAKDGSVANLTDSFVIWQHNIHAEDPCYQCPAISSPQELSCMLRRTLRVTDDIQQQALQQLIALYSTPTPAYTAVHLRLGGLTGESQLPPEDIARRGASSNQLQSFMSAVGCASK